MPEALKCVYTIAGDGTITKRHQDGTILYTHKAAVKDVRRIAVDEDGFVHAVAVCEDEATD